MKIDEILARVNNEIEKEYGIPDAIHTVILNHENFDRIVFARYQELMGKPGFSAMRFSPSDMNDLKIYGVRVLARENK